MTFRAALLLLVGPAAKFNVDRMAWRTQIPRAMVAACARRLFDNGQLCRRTDPLGRIEWAAPGSWRKSYEFNSEALPSLSVSYSCQTERTAPAEPEPIVEPSEAETPAEEAAQSASPKDTLRKARRRKPVVAVGGSAGVGESQWLGAAAPSQELFPGAAWLG
jgi:hypothetical protein